MAIPQDKYVTVQSSYAPADAEASDMSGLVVVGPDVVMKDTAPLKAEYDGCHMVALTFGDYLSNFAEGSAVAEFASKYFGYISPSGNVPSALKVVKMKDGETPLVAFKRILDEEGGFATFHFLGEKDAQRLEEVAAENVKYNNAFRLVVSVDYDPAAEEPGDDSYRNYGVTEDGRFRMWDYKGLTFTFGCPYLTMSICAATNYGARGGATTQMFKSLAGETARVADLATSDALDDLHINYYGVTKAYGSSERSKFFQPGVNADGTDTACYDNEIWFKRTVASRLLKLETTVEKIPPNPTGVAMAVNIVNSVVNEALDNGVILPEKPISENERAYVVQMAGGNPDAPETLNRKGYIVTARISTSTVAGVKKYKIVYRVIYLKGDAVKKIDGFHNII